MAQTSSNETGSILDSIQERAINIEEAANKTTIEKQLTEILKNIGRKERSLRESTITITIDNYDTITAEIKQWEADNPVCILTTWRDKECAYVQFRDADTKLYFIEDIITNKNKYQMLNNCIKPPNQHGTHFTRKPVKIEIPNIKTNITANNIKTILIQILGSDNAILSFKEGKINTRTNTRSLIIATTAGCILKLFGEFDGALPYNDKNTRTKLQMKIIAKPWLCRECFSFNQHECVGKRCGQCGLIGHTTNNCKSKTRYCNNCEKRGHKAKDIHCQKYITEVAKEIRKYDIPVEFYEKKGNREMLIKYIQLK